MSEAMPYPAEVVTLRDGTQVTIRAILPDDAAGLQALVTRLSPESLYLRAMIPLKTLSDASAQRLSHVDYERQMALVATREPQGSADIIGVARYAPGGSGATDEAEVAVVVEDAYQRQGLGRLLLRRLAAYARARGIRTFSATVLPSNTPVMQMIERTGLPAEYHEAAPGERQVRITLEAGQKTP